MYSGDEPAPVGELRRCAVLGRPIEHSLSPVLHTAGYRAAGLRGWNYERIDCGAEDLPDLVAALSSDWRGLSVTMPGKSAAAAVADVRSPRVDRLRVANTLVRLPDGGWSAENTDVDGVIGALAAHRVPVGGRALVLGGGGTALAVVAALAERGVDSLVVAGRRPESTAAALELAGALGLNAHGIGFDVAAVAGLGSCELVVSTVPAGAADPLAELLAEVPVVLDVVYHPWPTPLAAAGAADRVVVTGQDMLLHQAVRQFELFTGQLAPIAAMRDALAAAVPDGPPLPLPGDGAA
ncbi:MAG: shikimate dehydrogenase [Nakamurella sp.]